MKLRKLALVLVVVLMASTLTPALAKSPFSDVPADHWAYDSVVELAAAGLIEGYPDGTFGGARMMTRYEAAMVFARALLRLEAQIADIDILPALDQIKEELVAEIKAQLADLDAPVVETTIVERVIVDKDVDQATLARIRANEIANEILAGDVAYLEARIGGLIDGIRYDLNKVQEQVDELGLEIPSMDEIEALIAAKVEEGIREAALGAQEVVKETTVVERVIASEPELTEEDVELIAKAVITQSLQQYEIMIAKALRMTADHEERLGKLEMAQVDFATKEDLAAVEEDIAGVKDSVKALEKVKIGGTLKFTGKYADGEYGFGQTADLKLTYKASDTVNVSLVWDTGVTPHGLKFAEKTSKYAATITSETPIKSLTVGKLGTTGIGSNYVLALAGYGFGGVAQLDLAKDFTGTVLVAQAAEGAEKDVKLGLGLRYALMPELGLKVAVAADKPVSSLPENLAVGAGLFGKVAGIGYGLDFAMDLDEEEDNFIVAGNLNTEFGPLTLGLSGAYAKENYGINPPFVNPASNFNVEGTAGVDFLVNLNAAVYYEGDSEEEDAKEILAFKVEADKDFDLVVPFSVWARYWNVTQESTAKEEQHIGAGLSISDKLDFGLKYGLGAVYEKNELDNGPYAPNYKIVGHYSGRDVAKFNASLGYDFDWRGAALSLDYAADFRMRIVPEDEDPIDNELYHSLTFGYGFTPNVKLTLGGTLDQVLSTTVENSYGATAGLTISF